MGRLNAGSKYAGSHHIHPSRCVRCSPSAKDQGKSLARWTCASLCAQPHTRRKRIFFICVFLLLNKLLISIIILLLLLFNNYLATRAVSAQAGCAHVMCKCSPTLHLLCGLEVAAPPCAPIFIGGGLPDVWETEAAGAVPACPSLVGIPSRGIGSPSSLKNMWPMSLFLEFRDKC